MGCGPVGLAALMTAKFFSPSEIYAIDNSPHRLETAKELGATHTLNNSENTAVQQILDMTDNVGIMMLLLRPSVYLQDGTCLKVVRPGGNIAVLGVHGKSAPINGDMWKETSPIIIGLFIPTLLRT